MNSPAARFAQWKATLAAGSTGSPELEEVDFAYLPKNVAPRIDQIEITPPNFRFPPSQQVANTAETINLPPMGKRTQGASLVSMDSSVPSMQCGEGNRGRALVVGGRQWRRADL